MSHLLKTLLSLVSLFFISSQIYAQKKEIKMIAYFPMDTIKIQSTVKDIVGKKYVKGENAFFIANYMGSYGLFLLERKGRVWLVYSFDEYLSNMGVSKPIILDKKNVSIISYRHKGSYSVKDDRYTDEEYFYKFYFLINRKDKKYCTFMCSESIEIYKGKVDSKRYKSNGYISNLNIRLKDNKLIIKKTGKSSNLMDSGSYYLVD